MKKIVLILMSVTMNSFACMGPPSETRTFFKKLPKKLETKDYVAKVKIKSTKLENERTTEAQVLHVIKGKSPSNKFIIKSDGAHSCNRDLWIKKGDQVYIAGKFDSNGLFHGTWKGVN